LVVFIQNAPDFHGKVQDRNFTRRVPRLRPKARGEVILL